MESTDQITKQDDDALYEKETQAILAAKLAAGITYPLLIVEASHPTDPGKSGPRFAFRRPTPPEWHRYRSESLTNDPQVKANAFQSIVIPACVYPDRQSLLGLFQERPGLIELCGSELAEFAGAERPKAVARL